MNKNIQNTHETSLRGWSYGAAGAASGFFTRFTCQPFDVVKIRLQVQMNEENSELSKQKYRSTLQAIKTIAREESLKSFWKGHIPGQWLSVMYGAAQFATYEHCTAPWQKNTLAHFAGGGLSGVVAVVVSYPFDVLRTRLVVQAEPKIYSGMFDTGKKIAVSEGGRGFFKGLLPACIQVAPLSALVFGIHHILSSFLVKFSAERGTFELSPVSRTICAGAAGFSSKLIVYPFDLMKKRLQVQGMPDGTLATGRIVRTSGLLSCFTITIRNEGLRGLYKGLTPSLLKATVSNAVYISSYGLACKLLGCASAVT